MKMNRIFFSALFLSLCILSTAQMHVWSGGTIVFSHATESVDSISFSNGPVSTRVNATAFSSRPASLAGKTYYEERFNKEDSHYHRAGFVFISDTKCVYFNNNYYVDGYTQEDYTYNPTTGELTIGDDTQAIVNDYTIAEFSSKYASEPYCVHVYFLYEP